VLKAQVGIFFDRGDDQRLQPVGHGRIEVRDRRRLAIEDTVECHRGRAAPKRLAARRHFV